MKPVIKFTDYDNDELEIYETQEGYMVTISEYIDDTQKASVVISDKELRSFANKILKLKKKD